MHPRQVPAKCSIPQLCLLLWATQLLRQAGVRRGARLRCLRSSPVPPRQCILSSPVPSCRSGKPVKPPNTPQCTHTNLTTPLGRGRCSLMLRAWLQTQKVQSQPQKGSNLSPFFANITAGIRISATQSHSQILKPLIKPIPRLVAVSEGRSNSYLGPVSYHP